MRLILDHRRLAERVNRRQLFRREIGFLVARIAFDLIGNAEFFKQPQNALRAGVFKVMDDQHGCDPMKGLRARLS
ncbi:MAG: hypothetical protein R3C58_14355 [Parvularculaceae bacterium]